MIRVYGTNSLWRHDEILRIRHLEAEIADMQKEIDRQKEKAVAAGEGFQRTKTWLGPDQMPVGPCHKYTRRCPKSLIQSLPICITDSRF